MYQALASLLVVFLTAGSASASAAVGACSSSPSTCRGVTTKSHAPKGSVCGTNGTLAHPQNLQPPCTYPAFGNCLDACIVNSACKSFAYNAGSGECTLYKATLAAQGFKAQTTSHKSFYSKGCFSNNDLIPHTYQVRNDGTPYDGLYLNVASAPGINGQTIQTGVVAATGQSFIFDDQFQNGLCDIATTPGSADLLTWPSSDTHGNRTVFSATPSVRSQYVPHSCFIDEISVLECYYDSSTIGHFFVNSTDNYVYLFPYDATVTGGSFVFFVQH